ncbi:hypothetical protein [Dyadobacter sp. NIV53]|uniref:hypothetical protein n=1 Tax=Dyadobacter sp. NIV53 TaxID=2861765 RepID=UPI001C863B1E|nr:hypothetical protein [Dyadobacter sp. NIV53]
MISISTRSSCLARFLGAVIFIFFVFSTSVFSQGKFLDGYTVSLKGDTLQGLIRYEGWDESPVYIDFSSNKTSDIRKISSKEIKEFYITSVNARYKSKKIAVLNIDLSEIYTIPPSLQSKDSAVIFLREVTSGPKASLLEYINSTSATHFYIEKDSILTELIYYPFYRLIREKKYLLLYDDYKKQLPALLSDVQPIDTKIPGYSQKDLRKYIENYNEFFGGQKQINHPQDEHDFTIDFNFNGGIEGWEEPGILLKNRLTYGFGIRANLPRRFHNRYFKINLSFIPSVSDKDIYTNYGYDTKKHTLKTLEFGSGTYFGSGNIRPFVGIDFAFPFNTWRSSILGPHAGIGLYRKFNIEVSHFANLGTILSDAPFFNKPRITLSYYLNLNQLVTKK